MDEPPSAGGGAVGGMAQVQDSQPKDSKPNLNGALEAGKSYNASVSQPPYIPQFSAATSLILNRIKGGPHSFSSALTDASATVPRPDQDAYDDARTRLVQSMSTTLEMPPVPERPAPRQWLSSPAVAKEMPTTDSLNMGVKRKRDVEQVAVDFTQNTIVMPPPPPGRAAQQPHGYQSSEAANMAHEKTEVSSYKPRHGVDEYRQQKIEKIRQKRLAALPGGVAPAKPEQVGFGPGSASDYAVGAMIVCIKMIIG